MKLFDFKKKKADRLHQEARQLDSAGKMEEAIAGYLQAIACDPEKAESHYNLGLIYKYRGDWQRSFEFNQKANALNPDDEATRWNLAIAATALRNWTVARKKWKENGIEIEEGEGSIEMDFGMTPVRLNPDEDAEVVWAKRIDPARARIDSIPFPQSRFHYGDVVLNDGAPVGYRLWNEREYPVFNVLELFEPSVYTTCVATVTVESDSDLDALAEEFSATQSHFEDWTQNTRVLCRACSEGRPHEQHDHELDTGWSCERRLGVAIYPGDDIRKILNQWQQSSAGRVVSVESE
jgi:tetratricopeptide (TPR) repeat protein